jgi:hypothetical protein
VHKAKQILFIALISAVTMAVVNRVSALKNIVG